jgi:hypothetical protein
MAFRSRLSLINFREKPRPHPFVFLARGGRIPRAETSDDFKIRRFQRGDGFGVQRAISRVPSDDYFAHRLLVPALTVNRDGTNGDQRRYENQ